MASEDEAGDIIDLSDDDATSAVLAHGLINVLSVLRATAATLHDYYDEMSRRPEDMREALKRIERNADLAVALLQDLTHGVAIDIFRVLDELTPG